MPEGFTHDELVEIESKALAMMTAPGMHPLWRGACEEVALSANHLRCLMDQAPQAADDQPSKGVDDGVEQSGT